MHYYGHGGEVGWAEERVLELIDINSWENIAIYLYLLLLLVNFLDMMIQKEYLLESKYY